MKNSIKPTWVYQGKSICQVIEELNTFENNQLCVLISIDYGHSMWEIDSMESPRDSFLVMKSTLEESEFECLKAASRKNIKELIEELSLFENQEMEIRLSIDSGKSHKPISLVGKMDGVCALMSCSDFYDQKNR